MPPSKLTEAQVAEAYNRWQSGESFKDIGAEMGLDRVNLWRLVTRRYKHGKPLAHWAKTITVPDDLAELGYIAGIIDGEGNIQRIIGRKAGVDNWTVRVRMTDKEVIERLGKCGGKVYAHKAQSANRKPSWEWNLSRRADVTALLGAILPYLSVPEKCRRAREILKMNAISTALLPP